MPADWRAHKHTHAHTQSRIWQPKPMLTWLWKTEHRSIEQAGNNDGEQRDRQSGGRGVERRREGREGSKEQGSRERTLMMMTISVCELWRAHRAYAFFWPSLVDWLMTHRAGPKSGPGRGRSVQASCRNSCWEPNNLRLSHALSTSLSARLPLQKVRQ